MSEIQDKKISILIFSSTIQFTIAVLAIRFAVNLYASILMYLYSISFIYRPFGNTYQSVAAGNWTDLRLIIVYGLGVLLFFVAGILLARKLNSTKSLNWSSRLMLTWLAFIMVHMLPFSMAAAVVFYDDFGFVFFNLFELMIVRAILALFAIAITIYFREKWLWLFLRTSYSINFINSQEKKKQFIRNIFIFPWLFGSFLLLMFTFLPYRYWSWFSIIFLMGMVVLPLFNYSFPELSPRLNKSDKTIQNIQMRSLVYFIILIALFVFSFFKLPL